MNWDLAQHLLEQYGLPILGLLAVSWAWYRERSENRELNDLSRDNSVEMTAALVSIKEAVCGFRDVLKEIDARFDRYSRTIDDVASTQNERTGNRLEAIEKKLIELVAKMES